MSIDKNGVNNVQKDFFRELINTDRLIFGISEVCKMANVTPRQLRYWEQKGYLKSQETNNNKAREYNAHAMFKAILIKHFLDEGYTLNVAAQKIQKHMANMKIVQSIIREHFNGVEEILMKLKVRFCMLLLKPTNQFLN